MEKRTIRIVEKPRSLMQKLVGTRDVTLRRDGVDIDIFVDGKSEETMNRVYSAIGVAKALHYGSVSYDLSRAGSLKEDFKDYVLNERLNALPGINQVNVERRAA